MSNSYKISAVSEKTTLEKKKSMTDYFKTGAKSAYRGKKLLSQIIYMLPDNGCDSESLVRYLDTIYVKTHNREYRKYFNDRNYTKVGDSIIEFHFDRPFTKDGKELYVYHKNQGCIVFIDIADF
jgi:hypothetical protein